MICVHYVQVDAHMHTYTRTHVHMAHGTTIQTLIYDYDSAVSSSFFTSSISASPHSQDLNYKGENT